MPVTKCEEIIVQLVLRSYDEQGHAIGEATTQSLKLFRATTPDVWTHVDRLVADNLPVPRPGNGLAPQLPVSQ